MREYKPTRRRDPERRDLCVGFAEESWGHVWSVSRSVLIQNLIRRFGIKNEGFIKRIKVLANSSKDTTRRARYHLFEIFFCDLKSPELRGSRVERSQKNRSPPSGGRTCTRASERRTWLC